MPDTIQTKSSLQTACADNTSGAITAQDLRNLIVSSVFVDPATNAENTVQPTAANVVPLILKGATSQTADLMEVQNSSGSILTKIDASGNVTAPLVNATTIQQGGSPLATVALSGSYNDLSNKPTLGTAAAQSTGTFAQVANNLSDLASASTARTNLGLGTAATQSTSTFCQVGNNLSDVTASTALNNILPSQGSNSGKFLTTNGSVASWGNAGSGTVTSVALTVPSVLSVSGSPVTTSGTLGVSLATQSANQVFAGPSSGSAATPTFRALTSADVPPVLSLSGYTYFGGV